MTKLEHIEQAVAALPPEELKAFAEWFADLQAHLWDKQIEEDVNAGRCDKFAQKALADHLAGKTTPRRTRISGKPPRHCRKKSAAPPTRHTGSW